MVPIVRPGRWSLRSVPLDAIGIGGLLMRYDTQVTKNAEKKVEETLTVLLHELRECLFLLAIIIVFDN